MINESNDPIDLSGLTLYIPTSSNRYRKGYIPKNIFEFPQGTVLAVKDENAPDANIITVWAHRDADGHSFGSGYPIMNDDRANEVQLYKTRADAQAVKDWIDNGRVGAEPDVEPVDDVFINEDFEIVPSE